MARMVISAKQHIDAQWVERNLTVEFFLQSMVPALVQSMVSQGDTEAKSLHPDITTLSITVEKNPLGFGYDFNLRLEADTTDKDA